MQATNAVLIEKQQACTNKQLNELAPGHYEICDDSNKGRTRQQVKCPDQPRPRWEVAQKMHTVLAGAIDRKAERKANRKQARADRKAA